MAMAMGIAPIVASNSWMSDGFWATPIGNTMGNIPFDDWDQDHLFGFAGGCFMVGFLLGSGLSGSKMFEDSGDDSFWAALDGELDGFFEFHPTWPNCRNTGNQEIVVSSCGNSSSKAMSL